MFQRFNSLLSRHIQHRLVLVGQARAKGDPLVHLIIQGLWLTEAPPSDTQFRVPQGRTAHSYYFSPRVGQSLLTVH